MQARPLIIRPPQRYLSLLQTLASTTKRFVNWCCWKPGSIRSVAFGKPKSRSIRGVWALVESALGNNRKMVPKGGTSFWKKGPVGLLTYILGSWGDFDALNLDLKLKLCEFQYRRIIWGYKHKNAPPFSETKSISSINGKPISFLQIWKLVLISFSQIMETGINLRRSDARFAN